MANMLNTNPKDLTSSPTMAPTWSPSENPTMLPTVQPSTSTAPSGSPTVGKMISFDLFVHDIK